MYQIKRIITTIMIIVFSLTLIACGKVTYTKEFSYLPIQKAMTLKAFVKPTKKQMGVATYVVKNIKSKEALENYEKQLKKDGWKITIDKKPISITAEKDGHKTVIVPTQTKEDVQLTVVSK